MSPRALLVLAALTPLAVGPLARAEELPAKSLTADQREKLKEVARIEKEANRLGGMGQVPEALALWRKKIDLEREIYGRGHGRVIASLRSLADVHQRLRNYPAAREVHQEILGAVEGRWGKGHWRVTDARVDLEKVDILKGLTARQREDLRRVEQLRRQEARLNQQGKTGEAFPLAREIVRLTKDVWGEQHSEHAISLNNLAALNQKGGDLARALPLYERARDIFKKALGPRHPSYATSLYNLAALHKERGDYGRALPLYARARDLRKEALGAGHPEYARSLNNLALLYQDLGDHARALPLYEQARNIWKEALGEKHPQYAASLNNLAGLYQAHGDYARAQPLFERARDIAREILGEKDPRYAQSLNNLAGLFQTQGDYGRALPLYQEALAIRKEALGEGHPRYATSLHNLAGLYEAQGEYARAVPLFQKACALTQEALGDKHPRYASSLGPLAAVYHCQGRVKDAEALRREALAAHARLLDETLGGLAEGPRLRLLSSLRNSLDGWLSLAPRTGASPQEQYATLLRWRGASADTRAPAGLARHSPELNTRIEDLRRVRSRLAGLAFRSPSLAGREVWLRQLNALRARKEELEGELARASKPFRQLLGRREGKPEVGASLPRGTALVDFFIYLHSSPPSEGKHGLQYEPRLLAFVVTKGHPPRRLDLGRAGPVADAVRRWRQGAVGEKPDALGPAGDELREAVWEPLEKHLGEAKTVLIAPDGSLCSLPFAAVPGKGKGSYLIEEYAIGYLPSGRQLLDIVDPLDDREAEGLLVSGDVSYGEGIFVPLPGTGPEAARCRKVFGTTFPGKKATLLTQGEANEAKVKEALGQGPRWVHLATHGFFESPARLAARRKGLLRDEGLTPALRDAEEATFGLASLLKSGLALAGASEPPLGGEAEDGILTAEEVKGLDLGGCQLVTLSACQTGLGDVEGGQGVMGLQRAFHAAGARTVVASLWHVDDAATSLLMEEFYHQLWVKKRPRLEALRQAQLSLLRDPEGVARRAKELRTEWAKRGIKGIKALPPVADPKAERSHPALWAAFVLSGDWR